MLKCMFALLLYVISYADASFPLNTFAISTRPRWFAV